MKAFHTLGKMQLGCLVQKKIWSCLKRIRKNIYQYGGYCAYGMSGGYKAPTVIETWKILNGKLYFNYSLKVQELWNKDQSGFIQKADLNWEKVRERG